MASAKMTKNQMRRAKKKEEKKAKAEVAAKPSEASESVERETTAELPPAEQEEAGPTAAKEKAGSERTTPEDDELKVEAVEVDAADYDDPVFAQFRDVFSKFGPRLAGDEVAREANAGHRGEAFLDGEDGAVREEDGEEAPKLSKKKRKKQNMVSIAELKAMVRNPEVVEWHDVSSSDPRLLAVIKAQRNVVPVPAHWSLKREYLSSKRGIEKPPFQLPAFISETGITEMRDAVLEKQAEQTLKQKQRERVQPKMGKLDIDYQKLYEAFFRFQTKPSLTRFGDVYYEGKEWETEFRNFRPGGELGDALKEALNMAPGFPPPWLLQQQRMGPPPSYPNLKIPGLNAPLPPGAAWGFAPGQWGKPPVDEYNRPLYGGDIFGIPGLAGANGVGGAGGNAHAAAEQLGEPIERAIWGELQPPEEESEEEEEEDDDEDDEDDEEDDEHEGGRARDDADETMGGDHDLPSGLVSSVPTDYPAVGGADAAAGGGMDLRKQRRGYETEESVAAGGSGRAAYTVIPERQAQVQGFFGSDRTYDLNAVPVLDQNSEDQARKRKKPGDVDVALDPEALSQGGISKDELRRKFEQGRREEGVGAQWSQQYDEDLSEMIAQESRKRQKRDEERRAAGGEKKKDKYRF